MKDLMNIAVINFVTLWGDKEQNLSRITGYCEAAGKRGADFIVFPETALSGYDTDHDHPRAEMMHTRLAETIPGPSTEAVAEIAKKYGLYVVFGMPERANGTVYNSAAIIEPNGKTYAYRKIHLPFDESSWAEPGDAPVLIPTPWGPVGVTICYDTYCFPELIRYYRAMGARLTLNVTARTFPVRKARHVSAFRRMPISTISISLRQTSAVLKKSATSSAEALSSGRTSAAATSTPMSENLSAKKDETNRA